MPTVSQYVPAAHSKHAACPLRFWNCPTPHATQASRDTAPVSALYVPASQLPDGFDSPEPLQNMPTGQVVQADDLAPPLENDPTLQIPEGSASPVLLQCFPAGHAVH